MEIALRAIDFAALAPLLLLLFTALVELLLETFAEKATAKRYAFYVVLGGIMLSLLAALIVPPSENPLLTRWISFDPLARLFTILFLCIGLGCVLLASSFFHRYEATHGEFYFLLISSLFGLILIGSAADFLTLFLGLETLSIALYVLCGYMKRWEFSSESSIKYFLIGSVAAAFLLYGIALTYGATGTTNFSELLNKFQSLSLYSEKALFLGGIAFITMGLAFKAAIAPFHVWAPDVYEGAPTPVTAFMAVGTKVGAFAALARLFLIALPGFNPEWNQILSWLAILTLIYANFVALHQVQLRRFFAYSGISQAGFLLIPIVVDTNQAIPALAYYLIIYSLATLGSFAVLAFLDSNSRGVHLHDLHGLFRRAPVLAGIFSLCLLTLAGIPPTAGFFAKFYVLKLAYQAGYYPLIIVGLLTAIFSAFYYLRIVSVMFAEEPSDKFAPIFSCPAAVVGAFTFAAILIFSIFPDPLLKLIGTGS